MAITEETREEDERLRAELRRLDVEKLKKVLKPLVTKSKQPRERSAQKKHDLDNRGRR